MTAAKVAVTIPEHLLGRARAAVRRGEARSLSAYVSAALAEKTTMADLVRMLDEMLAASGGPLTKAEERAAERALYGSSRRRARR
ncbi:MAG TPA: hypothetical protein VHE35_10945 [Kofleriaceae bacterium]|nr:hypothetical protein [Kofleriaceae bacterium]